MLQLQHVHQRHTLHTQLARQTHTRDLLFVCVCVGSAEWRKHLLNLETEKTEKEKKKNAKIPDPRLYGMEAIPGSFKTLTVPTSLLAFSFSSFFKKKKGKEEEEKTFLKNKDQ